ncbi:MAG: hypothetical protein C0618_01450 [Desulfuromonas sp.]|nr:MAG: hypothetical protein C0618_01450 [Desulfuromonas sp.]
MDCHPTGKNCRCSYPSCSRHGNCCQCVAYHSSKGEFTACFFSPETEKTYDRSFNALCKDRGL